MAWALVTKSDSTVIINGMSQSVPANTVINLIVYNGVALYAAPADVRLVEVPDTTQIGDVVGA
jgi:gamma-glutamyl phosphate reductase